VFRQEKHPAEKRRSPYITHAFMLSYCTNIHPAESWAETREALFTCVPRIRQELAAMDSPLKALPLGIGLRLSARAAAE
ncbi:hypothetical protein DK853_42370, partial [Klebsiella oxytoca]